MRMHLTILAAAAFAASSAHAIPSPRLDAAETPRSANIHAVQFPVWGGFGDSPRGRPFVAGRPYGTSWWTPRNDFHAGRRAYTGPRFYYGYHGPRYYGPRYYSRRDLRRGWRR